MCHHLFNLVWPVFFFLCIFACMISLRSGPVGSKKWATQRLFAGSSSHPHTVILYSSRGVQSAPSPLPGSLPSPFLLCSISHCFSLNPWRVVLTSVWLLLLTYSSSGPRGIGILLWAHLTRLRIYSRNTLQGSLPIIFCILLFAWIPFGSSK